MPIHQSDSLRERFFLFKWIVEDAFYFLFIRRSPTIIVNMRETLYRMEKIQKEKG